MSSYRSSQHLRLVENPPQKLIDFEQCEPSHQERQFSFPYPEVSTVLFIFVSSMEHGEFQNIIGNYSPRWIIDVRAVPRLDKIATSRFAAFELFKKSKILYIDLFGRLDIKSYGSAGANPAFWGKEIAEILGQSEKKGPYLFLFDDQPLMNAADHALREIIGPIVGKRPNFQRIQGETVK